MFAIAAVSQSWGIGKDNRLLFHISADMKRFRALTLDKTVLMGRRTLESMPGGKGLPHDSAWIMLLLACGSLNLSKASQFGSPLAARRLVESIWSGRAAQGDKARCSFAWLISCLGVIGAPLGFLDPRTNC